MKATVILLAGLLFVAQPVAACDRPAAATPVEDDVAAVTALNLGWNQADLAADRGWFEHNLARDFVAVTSRRGAMEDKAFTRRVRYIDTYVRRDGRWQAWSPQGTEIKD